MAKNPNRRSKPVKQDEPLTGSMKFFLAGCVAELYLLIVRRFYINGNAPQQIAWYDRYLPILIGAGAAVFAAGAVLSALWKADRKKRAAAWYMTGGGAFLALATLLIRLLNVSAVTLLSVVVPVVMLLTILWTLYDRECAVSLTVLGASLVVLWVCHRALSHLRFGMLIRIGAVVFLVLLAAAVLLFRRAGKNQGKLGTLRILPADANLLPIYTACGLSLLSVAAALLGSSAAYYAMWALALVTFALAVYYTVKQL